MKTAKDIEHDFRLDLLCLLNKYNAQIETSDHYTGYSECGQDIRVMVSIPAIYMDEQCINEYTEFDLGCWITNKTICEEIQEANDRDFPANGPTCNLSRPWEQC